MSDTPAGDPLLSDLCIIWYVVHHSQIPSHTPPLTQTTNSNSHINPPKYRCPRCQTRTCSLPCSRRHKLWSQCSGVRDPAAYLRRNELATPAAFDRDFNFIAGIERSVERADRDAENRGIHIDHDHGDEGGVGVGEKRKRPGNDAGGLVKGEAGFLRGAQSGEVQVIRAPRGMTRNKQNNSRWHPKQKCLIWAVEWIGPDGERKIRTCLESCRVAEAYDRFYPLPKQERKKDQEQEKEQEQTQEPKSEPPTEQEQQPESGSEPPKTEQEPPSQPQPTEPQPEPTPAITSHRDVYFYLHRPRTPTKQPVLIPLAPAMTLTSALRGRTVLEFPTVYILPDSPDTIRAEDKESARFLLEDEYLQTIGPEEEKSTGQKNEDDVQDQAGVDLGQVDEKKVLEVLKQDLFEPVPAAAAPEV